MLEYNLSQLDTLSKKILSKIHKTDCIYLFGELGTGKTTFTRSLIHQLQKKNKVPKTEVLSPTYNLLHEYEIKSLKVMHYDFYRLKKSEEIDQLGIFENSKNVITIVEWPEKIRKKISNRLEITFYYETNAENRKIKLKGFGKWKNFKLDGI